MNYLFRNNVLDKGFIELIDMMPHPTIGTADSAVVTAARISYLGGSKGAEADAKLEKYLWDNFHHTPFEMVELKFRVKTPLFIARQWMRHRAASYNEMSLRYSKFEGDFYLPFEWGVQAEDNKQGRSEGTHESSWYYRNDLEDFCKQGLVLYKNALEDGVAKEMARMFLPVNLYTTFFYKADLRNVLGFIKLRYSDHAQYEIRVYASAIYDMLWEVAPIAMEAYDGD